MKTKHNPIRMMVLANKHYHDFMMTGSLESEFYYQWFYARTKLVVW
jgi:hypothetical protein